MLSRRDFLKSSTLLALAPTVPTFLAQTARAAKFDPDGRMLVVIQLDGGNDGINTVVPSGDEGYAKHRRALRLEKDRLIKLNDAVGLHPEMGEAGKLFEAGQLTIVQGVGYPNPSRSHFKSMAIWHSANVQLSRGGGEMPDPESNASYGWIGRALDSGESAGRVVPAAVFAGHGQVPMALRGRRSVVTAFTRPEDFILAPQMKPKQTTAMPDMKNNLSTFLSRSALDAYSTADRMSEVLAAKDNTGAYPATELGGQLRLIARLIKANAGTRVFYVRQPGYDTHAGQRMTHAALLANLAGAMRAFLADLAAAKLAERVAMLAFSEFGRTVKENGSQGTDHGTAGPIFLAGPGVKGGLVGRTPSLMDIDPQHGDLKSEIDFRQVYATVLDDWLHLPSEAVLGSAFTRLPLFKV